MLAVVPMDVFLGTALRQLRHGALEGVGLAELTHVL